MSINTSTARKVALAGAAALLALAAVAPASFAATGSIWTTAGNCASPNPQDQNEYSTGDPVVIRGSGFDANQAGTWAIAGQPGNASTDPGQTVASGNVTADAQGNFCVQAYIVLPGDDGTYTVDALGKNDNYHVTAVAASPTPTPTPTPTPAATPTPTPTPTGGTGGETASTTLPPTDSLSASKGSSDGLGLVLMALAGVLASVMVLTPARARRR